MQKTACLDDLTTAGTSVTGHTNPTDYESLAARDTQNPTGIPGIQVDGYFPDDSTSNTNNGWAHDSQFVLRFPDDWNGKLVVTGAPGVRKQYAVDEIISDFVLGRGYAYAATDKGNSGQTASTPARPSPGDAVAEWHRRVTELTRAAQATVAQVYGRAAGADLHDGHLQRRLPDPLRAREPPRALRRRRRLGGDADARRRAQPVHLPADRRSPTTRAGRRATRPPTRRSWRPACPTGSEFLWDYHEAVYWDLSQRVYREAFDPDYDGALYAGIPFCPPGTPSCDADYDYAARPDGGQGPRCAPSRTPATSASR